MLSTDTVAALAAPVFGATPHVGAAFVFGSVARGTATEASDVDVGVVGAGVDLLALGAALSAAFKREVDVVALSLDSPIPLLRAVLREAKLIYERSPGRAAEFASHARSVLDLDGPGYDRMMRAFLQRVARQGVGQ